MLTELTIDSTEGAIQMKPVLRAYLVRIASDASHFERLVLTPDASVACRAALDDVYAVEREKWSDEDAGGGNPFWVEGVSLVARTDSFSGGTGIITL